MTEDDKLLYDIESSWGRISSGRDMILTFVHKEYPSLFRIVDLDKETITFSDIDRIKRVRDINKILIKEDNEEENKKNYLPLIVQITNEAYPISMPYKKQILTCFMEAFPGFSKEVDTLGILYLRDETEGIEDSDMIEVKRYFKINPIGKLGARYEELDEGFYNEVKQKWINDSKGNETNE